ncbi:MAG: glycerate kinase [Clostridia bacterium]|nr:glycerate kinase [Clostridia bacterium]
MDLRRDAERIIREAIQAVMPEKAVEDALSTLEFTPGRLLVVAIGKAAWNMASAALSHLGDKVDGGCVITKYGHSRGDLPPLTIYEAGHPVPDENSYLATEAALSLTQNLTANDTVLFLVSGGGSSLFEAPLIDPQEMEDIGSQLLRCGAHITEINAIRKRLSRVKGGRFAQHCAPARVVALLLSDVLGDRPDVIASGPACVDMSGAVEPLDIVRKYGLKLSANAMDCLRQPLPDNLPNAENHISGSVRQLCQAAETSARAMGYEPVLLTDRLACEARDAGRMMGETALRNQDATRPLAFIAGGETVVHVQGDGLGGRNQELALSAVPYLAKCRNTLLFSVGSDGTDGPTDAAGGMVDANIQKLLQMRKISLEDVLRRNDAYHALKAVDGLIFTGPTGTNVNDLTVLLIDR